ncbi:MAG: response regulator [Saprospiraceae bacterium]|nr:response regulator [Saprospiraceae bacterium]MCB0626947.1 response regulator [Saprospiraceae bacterium]MCB0676968.1 response regulator [Saprospiraceae bacterium]MCB0680461.1 response regulator [Saprospiraceae bacterium]
MNQNRSAKILIVDDEPNIVVALEFLLQQQGFVVEKAYNGQEALDKLSSFRPGIVILDVMMPGMDGFEVARRIRQQPSNRNTQIIFLTAKGTDADKIKGYSAGGEVYITKPFDNDELIQTVQEVVEFG